MQPEMSLTSPHRMVWTALCAALMAVGAFAQFPLWGVPFSMQPLFALLAGFLLGPRLGLLSMALYVAAGAAGLPVFAGGRSGLAHLLGPTGGYLLGFVLAAGVTGRAGPAPLSWGRGLALGLVALTVVYGVGLLRLRAVLGFDWPTAGSLRVGGEADPGRLRGVAGLVLQEVELQIIGSTVAEDLCLGLRGPDAEDRARDMARRFSLEDRWDEPVQRLSHGQKRRLCLAAALLAGPRVLLLDEPFAGLDHPGILEMRAILRRNREAGLTQVVAAHDLEAMADLVDVWALLDNGRLAAFGDAAGVFPRLLDHGVRPPCAWLARQGLPPWP